MKFNDILEKLETDGKILDFKFSKTKIPMYLLIRFVLLQSLINKEFDLINPHVKENKKSIKDIFKYIYHTLKSNVFFALKKDIYIFTSEITNKLVDGKYVNRLYDEFYNLYKDKTQIIGASHNKSYSTPKKEKIYYSDILNIIIVIFSKVARRNQKDNSVIEAFVKYLKSKDEFDTKMLNHIQSELNRLIKREKISVFVYRLFFKIKKPKMILVNAGFYGDQSFLIYAAKSLGIKVAEYQHGYIGLAHPAYNYHENILENIKEYFPEYLLTHGKYWSSRVRVPANKIEVGLPSLIKNVKPSNKKGKTILFISGGTVPDDINYIIESSYEGLVDLGYKIILRPHPSEYTAIEKRYTKLIQRGVSMDKENLYESLNKVEVVVGLEVSTVLFEAVCFTNKVYLMNTNYTRYYEPQSCFLSFIDSEELLCFIKNNVKLSYSYDYFWEQNWKNNYIRFIDKEILEEIK